MEHVEVISVYYGNGAVVCDLLPIREDNQTYTKVPVMKPHSGFVQIPEQGDTVATQKLSDGTRFISHIVSVNKDGPNDMREGEVAIQLDSETQIYFQEKNDDTYDINISTSENLNLDSGGKIRLNGQTVEEIIKETVDGTNHNHG